MEELENSFHNNKKIEIERMFENMLFRRYKTALYKESGDEYYFYKPKDNDQYVDFKPDEAVRVLIYTQDGIYIFNSTVKKNGTKLVKLLKAQKYRKVQRRGLLRIPLPIKVKIDFKKGDEQVQEEVKIVDISGSGISFNTDTELFQNKKIIVHFAIEGKDISSIGEIIEIRKNRKTQNGKYRLSVRFISLDKKDTDFIVKHCLIYQIKLRAKERENLRG